MKDIKEKLQEYYINLTKVFDTENDSPKLLHRKSFSKRENEELLTGIIVVFLIITILLSFVYYFLVFAPQHEEFNNLKQEKINKVHSLLSKDEV